MSEGWGLKLAALSLLAAGAAFAQVDSSEDESDFEKLLAEPVVSAASRTAESSSDSPGTTWIISGTDLKRFGIQSVEEAIRYLGHGMTSYEFDARQNAAFGARGYSSDNLGLHIAVLIDGNQAGGSSKTARGTQQYLMPIELVDHIEVVIGPGSVVYGNSAMVGVINIVTRSQESIEGLNAVAQASGGTPGDKWAKNLSWGEAWAKTSLMGRRKFKLGKDPFDLAWHFSARVDRQQGKAIWRSPEGEDVFAGDPFTHFTREDDFNRDFGTRLFGKASWGKWSFLGWTALTGGTGVGPIEGSGKSSYLEPEFGLDGKWSTQVSDRGDLTLRTYAVVFNTRVNTVPNSFDTQLCSEKVGTARCYDVINYLSIKPFFEPILAWDWKQDGEHVTTVGGQVFIDGVIITTGLAAEEGTAEHAEDPIIAPIPTAAAYAQHIWRADFGTLNVGLRGDLGLLGSAVSPRAAYNRELWDDATLKFVFSTGFRTPVITERYLEIPNFLAANDRIKPERVFSGEIDLAQRLGGQSLQLSLYTAYWDQLIRVGGVTIDGEQLNQFQNANSVWSAGVNAGWQGKSGPLDWGLSLNYAPGRRLLPRGVAEWTDEQLAEERLPRDTLRFRWDAFGRSFVQADSMPDAYGTGHISYALSDNGARFSLAAHVRSPASRGGITNNAALVDPRQVDTPFLPWALDLRGGVEAPVSDRIAMRLIVSGRNVATVSSPARIGDLTSPVPYGGIGTNGSLQAPVMAMLELNARL